ncbi:MAG TPA: NAD(P)/FAD-dependent oxidoreductase [Candidatus Binataceae bacterium]|nr:NAD(P)/FAD-dependent oxidoreductase [Candidatus Binataceae bacterium]
MTDSQHPDFDAVIVGSGFAGMYMLHSLRDKLGLAVRVYETGDGVGGTWYWNRYPGARCDTDSYIYCYTFDKQLQQEWEWSERYPEQPEILRYLNHVADRLALRRDIQFKTRVTEAVFDERANRWTIRTEQGDVVTAKYFIGAVGCLSSANLPPFKGLETYRGKHYHTGHWPHGGVDFTAKRVGIVGTGATAVQAIPVIAQQAKHLTVFQRTPNFCVPARNGKVDPEVVKARKANYEAIGERVRKSMFGYELTFIDKSALEASPEERERVFNEMWDHGGFNFWIANYQDMLFDKKANEVCAEFLRRKIRDTVKDPAIAEKLIPKTYPYGTKRQPLDTNYFETFNKTNVLLVDVNETPIVEITPKGIRTSDKEYEFDIIVFATGFDAMTGPLKKINIRGRASQSLAQKWGDGPHSYLGVAMAGFPNMFTITGPGSPSVMSNMPVSIEQHVDWITGCIEYMRKHGIATIEVTPEAEAQWTAHVAEVANASLMPEADSWYLGANIPGKPRVFMPYLGGVGPYRQKCDEVAAKGYEGFSFSAGAA